MSRVALASVVALTGAAVLVLEILGTRVLGPDFGVSLLLWSVLISVTLAALAAGYALGGRWAGTAPSAARLALLPGVAGAWVLLIPFCRGALGAATRPWDPTAGLLVCAAVLFFPPLMLLGMVGPYAIRLGTHSVDEVGRVSGNLFAVSTLASVAAALATGFTLIPVLGVTRLLMAVSLALFVAAAIAWLSAKSRGGVVAAMLGMSLAVVVAGRSQAHVPGVLAKIESRYAQLRVIDVDNLRYLLIDGSPHTILDTDEGEPRQPHVYAAEIAADLFARHGRMLLLGLGGGAMAEVFSRHGWDVDAVEVDREVARLAAQFFRLKPFHARVVIGDAREEMRRSHERYDVVMFDACGGASIPFHLVTREAFAEAKAHLTPDGVVMLNTEAVGWQDPIVHALAATLRTQFRNVFAMPTAEPQNAVGNVVLMASDRDLDVTSEQLGDPVATLSDDDEHFRVLSRRHAWENRYDPRMGRVLTDDWNPIDLRGDAINRAMRAKMRTILPDSLLRD